MDLTCCIYDPVTPCNANTLALNSRNNFNLCLYIACLVLTPQDARTLRAPTTGLGGDPTTMPSVKRQRSDSAAFIGSRDIRRSWPWFDDGNIVLQADSTQFRIFRGVLSSASAIFKDMFSTLQPSSDEGLVEGCPVVYLHDSAQDWQHVLKALYERR